MKLCRLSSHPTGPRLEILGFRIHHGAVGVLGLLASGLAVAHDWKDRRSWFRDLRQ